VPAAPRPSSSRRRLNNLIDAARCRPELSRLFCTFRASVRQIYVNVDRAKAKQQNVEVTDIFQTLQVYLGGFYINDFNYLGRTWHVMPEADAPFRATAAQVTLLKTRNAAGEWFR
jgi:multidrug efflux pump subunit AcrB